MNHHSIQKALLVINNMLKNLKYQMFIHIAADHAARGVGASTLMEEYMDASNFGVRRAATLVWGGSNFVVIRVLICLCAVPPPGTWPPHFQDRRPKGGFICHLGGGGESNF